MASRRLLSCLQTVGTNTVAVADASRTFVEIQKPCRRASRRSSGDQSIFIKASIESIQKHLIEGSILAAIVVVYFSLEFSFHRYCGTRHPDVVDCHVWLDGGDGFTLTRSPCYRSR